MKMSVITLSGQWQSSDKQRKAHPTPYRLEGQAMSQRLP
jgi:hypothetical protein